MMAGNPNESVRSIRARLSRAIDYIHDADVALSSVQHMQLPDAVQAGIRELRVRLTGVAGRVLDAIDPDGIGDVPLDALNNLPVRVDDTTDNRSIERL